MNGHISHDGKFNHDAAAFSDSAASPRGEGNYFVVPNALIDDGHLASLTRVELSVYLVLKRHENSVSGTAWPGATRVARLIGHRSSRHVRRAIARLLSGGYLQTVSAGGGNAPAHRRIRLPMAKSATGGGIGHGCDAGSPVAETAMGAVAESATSPVSISAIPPVAESATRTRRVEQPEEEPEKKDKAARGRGRRRQPKLTLADARMTQIPLILDTPTFRTTWDRFLQYRDERRELGTLTGTQVLLDQLAGFGATEAAAKLNMTMANQWRGVIFPDNRKNGATNGNTGYNPGGARRIQEDLVA